MVPAGPVFLYHFTQNISLRIEFDSLVNSCHGLLYLLPLSFDFKIIPKAIFNNQGNDEYGMRKGRLNGSGYLLLEIRFCLM